MKELSIKEKAKRYDEAIKKLCDFYRDYDTVSHLIDVKEELANLFTELKEESEDERIRKALIEYFNEQCDMSDWNGVYGYQVVAWLEKQETSYTKRDVDNAYVEGMAFAKDELEKQKHAWSEEDENGLGDALWCCKQAASIAKDENDMGNVWYAEHWLKSLKERYTWKPKAWEIQILESVIEKGENPKNYSATLHSILEQLKKLKGE